MDRHFVFTKGASLVAPILAFVPFVGLIAVGLLAAGANLRPGAVPAVVFLSALAGAAAIPVLARLTVAPWIVAGSVVVGWIGAGAIETIASWRAAAAMGIDGPYPGGSGTGGLVAVLAVAAGVALWRRAAFTRPARFEQLLPRARQGLDPFFRDPSSGPRRALVGVGLLALAFVLVGLAMPDASPGAQPPPWAIVSSGGMLALGGTGGGLVITATRIPDEASLDDDSSPTSSEQEPPDRGRGARLERG